MSLSLEQQLESLTEKVQLLVRQQARMKKEMERLQKELDECRSSEKSHLDLVFQLEQRIAILKYAAGELPDTEKKQFEKTINGYIRELDKVIAYLSQ